MVSIRLLILNPHVPEPIIIIIITPWDFFASALADSLLLESEWQHVSSSLGILADHNNAVVCMVSTRPFFFHAFHSLY